MEGGMPWWAFSLLVVGAIVMTCVCVLGGIAAGAAQAGVMLDQIEREVKKNG